MHAQLHTTAAAGPPILLLVGAVGAQALQAAGARPVPHHCGGRAGDPAAGRRRRRAGPTGGGRTPSVTPSKRAENLSNRFGALQVEIAARDNARDRASNGWFRKPRLRQPLLGHAAKDDDRLILSFLDEIREPAAAASGCTP